MTTSQGVIQGYTGVADVDAQHKIIASENVLGFMTASIPELGAEILNIQGASIHTIILL